MRSEKKGFYTILPLQEINTERKNFNTLQDFFRLWVVRDNLSIPDTGLDAGDLARSLCFYPLGYRPDIPYEYLSGYAVWFDQTFIELNPHLKRFSELLAQWRRPTIFVLSSRRSAIIPGIIS